MAGVDNDTSGWGGPETLPFRCDGEVVELKNTSSTSKREKRGGVWPRTLLSSSVNKNIYIKNGYTHSFVCYPDCGMLERWCGLKTPTVMVPLQGVVVWE